MEGGRASTRTGRCHPRQKAQTRSRKQKQVVRRKNGPITAGMSTTSGVSAVAAELIRRGCFATVEGVDGHIRQRMGLGGSTWSGVDYLRRNGLSAEERFGGTLGDLRNALGQGFGVIVTFAHDTSVHTVIVT